MMKYPMNVPAISKPEPPKVLQEDVGGSGESSAGAKILPEVQSPNHSLNETGSGDLSPFDTTPGILPTIGYWILRIVFYLAIFVSLFVGGVYLAKLTGIYDACETNTYVTTQCEAEPYANGLLYYVKCTEESFCLLPGFWSTSYSAGWSLNKPDTDKMPSKKDFVSIDDGNEETAIPELVESA